MFFLGSYYSICFSLYNNKNFIDFINNKILNVYFVDYNIYRNCYLEFYYNCNLQFASYFTFIINKICVLLITNIYLLKLYFKKEKYKKFQKIWKFFKYNL